jgi:hypothetical protein
VQRLGAHLGFISCQIKIKAARCRFYKFFGYCFRNKASIASSIISSPSLYHWQHANTIKIKDYGSVIKAHETVTTVSSFHLNSLWFSSKMKSCLTLSVLLLPLFFGIPKFFLINVLLIFCLSSLIHVYQKHVRSITNLGEIH